jgi:hypothetical protein
MFSKGGQLTKHKAFEKPQEIPNLTTIRSKKDIIAKGENTLQGGQDYCHIILFFWGPMFELQPCHYYERVSQYFCIILVG